MVQPIIKENTSFILNIMKIAGAIITFLGVIGYFIYQNQALPPRVDKLEKDLPAMREELRGEINSLRSQIDKNSVKTDIILEDIKFVKSAIISEQHKK